VAAPSTLSELAPGAVFQCLIDVERKSPVLQHPTCFTWCDSLDQQESQMATKLKVVEEVADIVPAPEPPQFEIAPTRNKHSGWTAERQRSFIERLSLTGSVGEAAAIAGVSSRSAYRLRPSAARPLGTLLPRRRAGDGAQDALRLPAHLAALAARSAAVRFTHRQGARRRDRRPARPLPPLAS